ncbi:hypothetical protein L3V79_02035 [Thiotrichales bacterium 19S9-12]|nr:hypothetical protein [Thiotrichales bacterium 19S9-11]MCF6811137.1 hypothetical protein [Thiotrichales bacterium 19S9-12]
MKRLIRWFIYILLTLIILLLIGMSILWFSLDLNQYKKEIEQMVKRSTGKTLSIHGGISWHFNGKNISIDIGKSSLLNDSNQTDVLASWQSAEIQINPWSMVSYYFDTSKQQVIPITKIDIPKAIVKDTPISLALQTTVNIYQNEIMLDNIKGELKLKNKLDNIIRFHSYRIKITPSILTSQKVELIINNQFDIDLINSKYLIDQSSYYGHISMKGESLNELTKLFNYQLPKFTNNNATSIDKLTFNIKGSPKDISLNQIKGNLGKSQVNGNLGITLEQKITIDYSIDLKPFIISDYIDLKGTLFSLSLLHSHGKFDISKASNDQYYIYGSNIISSPKGILKGINLNQIAKDMDELIQSIHSWSKFQSSLVKINHQMKPLLSNQGQINSNNGLTTEVQNINITNKLEKETINTTEISLQGDNFYLTGNGHYYLDQNAFEYIINAYPYSPQTKHRQNDKGQPLIYIPYAIFKKNHQSQIRSGIQFNTLLKQIEPLLTKNLHIELGGQLKNNKELNDKINQFLQNL